MTHKIDLASFTGPIKTLWCSCGETISADNYTELENALKLHQGKRVIPPPATPEEAKRRDYVRRIQAKAREIKAGYA